MKPKGSCPLVLQFEPNQIISWTFSVVAFLALAHAIFVLLYFQLGVQSGRHSLSVFNSDFEQSFANWVSSMLLALNGIGVFWISALALKRKPQWRIIGAFVIALSCDEVAGLHERVKGLSGILRSWGVQLGDAFYYEWTLPVLLVLPILITFFAPFVRDLPPADRNRMLSAFACYFGGAVGIELLESKIMALSGQRTMAYHWLTVVEESMEMAGAALGLRAVLMVLADAQVETLVRVGSRPIASGDVTLNQGP